MAQFGQRFEVQEHKLDLPPRAIPLEHVGSAELDRREGREDDYVLGLLGLADCAGPPRGCHASRLHHPHIPGTDQADTSQGPHPS